MVRSRLYALSLMVVALATTYFGCTGMRFQEAVDHQGNVVLRSNNYDVRTKEIYIVHQTASGTQLFLRIPNSTFKANAWFTYRCEIPSSRLRGMSAVDGPGDNFLKQGDIAIGKPFQPVFDDWSNPCWGVDIERVRLEEVSRGDLPISPPEIVPSIWTGEPPPGLEEETIQDCHLTNALISAFFRGAAATTIEVDSATGQAYIKKGKIMFLIDLIDPYTNTYRVVAFTKEPAPDAEESK